MNDFDVKQFDFPMIHPEADSTNSKSTKVNRSTDATSHDIIEFIQMSNIKTIGHTINAFNLIEMDAPRAQTYDDKIKLKNKEKN